MKKSLKYILLLLAVAVVGYKSVYVEKLSTHNTRTAKKELDVKAFVRQLWEKEFPAKIDSAVSLPVLIQAVTVNKAEALAEYTHALAIGNYRYALVTSKVVVKEVREDDILLAVQSGDSTITMKLATEFIYGNAIRDASGLVQVKDFPNTADLSSISEALNGIVRTELVPAIKGKIKTGAELELVAAIELNQQHLRWNDLELYPVRIKIKQP